jgi:hypothetical protein
MAAVMVMVKKRPRAEIRSEGLHDRQSRLRDIQRELISISFDFPLNR